VLVLALDTASAAVTAGVVAVHDDGPRLLAERVTLNARAHGELLAPSVADCLRSAGVGPRDLAAVVAGLGPGPFTGLRVGLVTAGSLGDALGIPTYGVCSLDAVARDAGPGRVLVAGDARRREIYWARYDDGARRAGPAVDRPGDVPLDEVDAMAGAGARLYADVLGLPLRDADHPSPLGLVRCAWDRLTSGASSEALTPLYLRRPDATEPGAAKQVLQ
jgi:tRNA threonylcarbamoyl adenosine modification protein YeaZ